MAWAAIWIRQWLAQSLNKISGILDMINKNVRYELS